MNPKDPKILKLPPFRKDLKIYEGPYDPDGSPTYNIHDPVKGFFAKITWKEYLLIKNYHGNTTAEELAEKISRNFPFKITVKDVNDFFSQAFMLGLLSIPIDGSAISEIHQKTKQSWFQFFTQNLFFIRIPLFRPDALLTRTLPYVKFLGSKLAFMFYAILIILGLVLLLNRFEEFFSTFTYIFNFQNLLMLGIIITFVKCVHELSHAYVAKNFGIFIPTIGIGLLFFWPVLYTDVTESWKLMKRKQRFYISIAGIASELVLAGLATIGWIMASSGLAKSLFFLLASTTWFSSLIININPFIRFDGYYILSDVTGIDNLMQRSFNYTRWCVHRYFFGIDEPCPEEKLTKKRATGLIFYTMGTITYRIFMYTAIVLIVYHMFTKVVGILLFLSEVWILFAAPLYYEVQQLYQRRDKMKVNLGSLIGIFLVSFLALWFLLPWPHEIRFDGVIVPKDKQVIYSPESGQIQEIMVKMGQKVTPGMSLVRIESAMLNADITSAQADHNYLKNELLYLSSDHETESLISKKQAEVAHSQQLLYGLKKRKENLDIRSEINGFVVNWDSMLKAGQFVHERQVMGSIANPKEIEVIAFAQETDIEDLKIGQAAKVYFQSSDLITLEAEVIHIDRKRVNELIYPSLASIYGGPLAVVPKKNPSQVGLGLHDSYFQITLALKEPHETLNLGSNVAVKTEGPWRSYFVETLKYLTRVITKESSF